MIRKASIMALALTLVASGIAATGIRKSTSGLWLVYKTTAKLSDNYSCASVPRPLDRLRILPGGVLPSARSTADDPAWSPNGKWIAFSSGEPFCSNADGIVRDSAQIWIVESNGRHLHSVTSSNPISGGPADASPSWSPDGRRIAFARFNTHTGTGGIYVVGSNGRDLQRLSGRTALSLDWSPDGRSIAFVPGENLGPYYSVGNRAAVLDIRSRRVLSFHVNDPYDLAWSPSGSTIAVTTGNRTISIVDPRRKLAREITVGRPGHLVLDGVTWSPDGRRLAYSLGGKIFTIGLDGRGLQGIVAGAAPDWRP